MKLNTNSNVYTLVYASVLVIFAAFLLAFVASALKSKQDENIANDKRGQILAALNIRNTANVVEAYKQNIVAAPVLNVKERWLTPQVASTSNRKTSRPKTTTPSAFPSMSPR